MIQEAYRDRWIDFKSSKRAAAHCGIFLILVVVLKQGIAQRVLLAVCRKRIKFHVRQVSVDYYDTHNQERNEAIASVTADVTSRLLLLLFLFLYFLNYTAMRLIFIILVIIDSNK